MNSKTKNNRRQALEAKIVETHDMQQEGQVYSWEACGVQGTDRCTICGLTHRWGSHGQNTGSFDLYQDFRGAALTLAEAADLACG